MIMFFDVETTGLPRDWKAPMQDLDNWPRVIQLAWESTDGQGNTLRTGNHLIRPDGWQCPADKFWLENGFTQEKLMAEGKPLTDCLAQFVTDLQVCNFLVSHNMSFDYNVVGSEMIRAGMTSVKKPMRICTKEASVQVCKIPFAGRKSWPGRKGGDNYKWPKLEELHMFLFGTSVADAHDASGDVAALKNCFFELCKRRVITLTPDGVAIQ